MGQKTNVLSKVDDKAVSKYKDRSIQHHVASKLEFDITVAGAVFNDIEEAINHAYRCGLADQSKKGGTSGVVDQDELYRLLKHGNSVVHKADFLREIAKEWFPIELHNEKKIKAVHLELIEMANFLEK